MSIAIRPFLLRDTVYNLNIDEIGQGGSLETHELNLNQPESRDCLVDAEVFANRGITAQSFVGDAGRKLSSVLRHASKHECRGVCSIRYDWRST